MTEILLKVALNPNQTNKQTKTKIPKGQTEIDKSEDRQDRGQQNKTKDKHKTHDTTLKTKAGVARTLQKPGWIQVLRKGKQLLFS